MLLMKILVVCAFALVTFLLYRTWHLARSRHAHGSAITAHRSLARRTLSMTVIAIVLTEVLVRMNGGIQDKPFFLIHLAFAAPFLLLLITQQWMTGLKAPGAHKVLGYGCFATYAGTVVTGGMLLANL